MAVTLGVASYVSDDFVALFEFYRDIFDLQEVTELHSDIFRGLDLAGVTLGFHAPAAYELLDIEKWRDAKGTRTLLLFEVESDAEVDERSAAAVQRGATLIHPAYLTYYDAYQTVLADPDDNVFRINHFH